MKTTPNFGFQVAEPTDPAKQYPSAVDDPFKATLDTLLHPAVKDTGWRDVSAGLVNGWAGSLKLRRAGPSVEIHARDLRVPATWNATIYTIPDGFRPNGSRIYRGHNEQTLGSVTVQITSGGEVSILGAAQPAGNDVFVSQMWFTSNAWPVSLPGVPSGLLLDAIRDADAGLTDPMPAGES